MLKKIGNILVFIILILGVCFTGITVSAEKIYEGKIKIGTVSALPGEDVLVPIHLEENPGMNALTISITYDPDVLTYKSYEEGQVINDYNINPIPQKEIIRYVAGRNKNTTATGPLIYIWFTVKEDAPMDFYKIDISYSSGDFSNWSLQEVMPTIESGGIEVKYNGKNCKHKEFGEWTLGAVAKCEIGGLEQRVCSFCGHTEYRDTDPIGHKYSENWIVDKQATEDSRGEMSRHCERCEKSVDKIYFSLPETQDGKIDNEIDAQVSDKEYAKDLFEEQNPNKQTTPDGIPNDSENEEDGVVDKIVNSIDEIFDDKDEEKNQSENSKDNSLIWIIVGIISFAVIIAVISLIIIKKKK